MTDMQTFVFHHNASSRHLLIKTKLYSLKKSSARVRCRPLQVIGEEIAGPINAMSNLMRPETATIVTASIAVLSVGLNLYGTLLTEKSRSKMQREVGYYHPRRS